jgi:mannose-1-phosphate guanylyltransferase
VEVEGRDTAPAVAWATLEIARRYGEDVTVGFFPADHWIGDEDAFRQTLLAAEELAQSQQAIATLGIQPTYPSTGYGYIEQGESLGTYQKLPAYTVSRFTEKPDRPKAEEFLASGRFCWNAGMFIFQVGVALAELHTHAPEIIGPLEQHGPSIYPKLPKLSIDYALMEKTQKAVIVPVSFAWDDLGDWNAIERLLKQEGQANVELGQHIGLDTTGSLIYATDDQDLVVTIGLEDVVVVRDQNVTLIVRKDRTQDIKTVLKTLQQSDRFQDRL